MTDDAKDNITDGFGVSGISTTVTFLPLAHQCLFLFLYFRLLFWVSLQPQLPFVLFFSSALSPISFPTSYCKMISLLGKLRHGPLKVKIKQILMLDPNFSYILDFSKNYLLHEQS